MSIEQHPYYSTADLNYQLGKNYDQIFNEGYRPGGIWFNETVTIICGTFPPYKEYFNRRGYVHYSSPRNQCWKHIDSIYQTTLFIPSNVANDERRRIQNANEKISFAKSKKLGFVDVFAKIGRKKIGSSKDADLIGIETIFDNETFEHLIGSNVQQIAFVYSLSRKIFMDNIREKYHQTPKLVRAYYTDGIPLEVHSLKLFKKEILLSYSPIHGPIEWDLKQSALKKVIEFNLD